MKIKTVRKIVSDSGIEIDGPRDGFIVQGNIYVAQVDDEGNPGGGLVGNAFGIIEGPNKGNQARDQSEVRCFVYTKKEMLCVLGYTEVDLRNILEEIVQAKANRML